MIRAERAAAAVEALLDRQRVALLSGDLATLATLPDPLGLALRQLSDSGPPEPLLARLRGLADHNGRLLQAAQRGIAQVRDRAGARGGAALTTYDAAGQKTAPSPSGRLLSRR